MLSPPASALFLCPGAGAEKESSASTPILPIVDVSAECSEEFQSGAAPIADFCRHVWISRTGRPEALLAQQRLPGFRSSGPRFGPVAAIDSAILQPGLCGVPSQVNGSPVSL